MGKKYKSEKAITLVALVITIIVLLILAGVSISTLTAENGILKKAKEATDKSKIAEQEEGYALQSILEAINNVLSSEEGFNSTNSSEVGKQVNSPKITKGMIPIKWDGTNWVVCTQDDTSWYSYDSNKK